MGKKIMMKNKIIQCLLVIIFIMTCVFKLGFAIQPFPATYTDPDTGDVIPFEEYIKSVLLAEMPYCYGWHPEAIRALSVAARCVYMRMGPKQQAYKRYNKKDPDHVKFCKVIDDIAGQGIVYGDNWIYAYHFSHDAADFTGMPLRGHTVNNEDSSQIGGWAKPWLRQKDCNCKAFQQQILAWKERRGHGVGLCQFGAWEMAKKGKSYKEILTYYYNLHMPYVKSVIIKQGVETPKYYAYWSEDGNKRTLQPTTQDERNQGIINSSNNIIIEIEFSEIMSIYADPPGEKPFAYIYSDDGQRLGIPLNPVSGTDNKKWQGVITKDDLLTGKYNGNKELYISGKIPHDSNAAIIDGKPETIAYYKFEENKWYCYEDENGNDNHTGGLDKVHNFRIGSVIPRIVSVSPKNDAINVPPNTRIIVKFSEEMDLYPMQILSGDGKVLNGEPIDGTDNKEFMFKPKYLTTGTNTFDIKDSAKSKDGICIDGDEDGREGGDYSWSFTVGGDIKDDEEHLYVPVNKTYTLHGEHSYSNCIDIDGALYVEGDMELQSPVINISGWVGADAVITGGAGKGQDGHYYYDPINGSVDSLYSGGGSYGGRGGDGGFGGMTYGSASSKSTLTGSSGGNCDVISGNNSYIIEGGKGGGSIALIASQFIDIKGARIAANGGPIGTQGGISGGSGGGILLDAPYIYINKSTLLIAKGGAGYQNSYGGGGGGGRIKLFFYKIYDEINRVIDNIDDLKIMSVLGGSNGEDGTIYYSNNDVTLPSNPTVCNAWADSSKQDLVSHDTWQNTNKTVYFEWSGANDGNGTGIKGYYYGVGHGLWTFTEENHCVISVNPGSYDLILRTEDNAGNISQPTTLYTIKYDPEGPFFTGGFSPSDWWQNNLTPDCIITVRDNGSGLDVSSSEYQYTTDGGAAWSKWLPSECTGANGTTEIQTITAQSVPFNQDSAYDSQNQIRFRILDVLDNVTISNSFSVKIDAVGPAFISFSPSPNSIVTPDGFMMVFTLDTFDFDQNSVVLKIDGKEVNNNNIRFSFHSDNFSYTPPDLAQGRHTFTLSVQDDIGRINQTSGDFYCLKPSFPQEFIPNTMNRIQFHIENVNPSQALSGVLAVLLDDANNLRIEDQTKTVDLLPNQSTTVNFDVSFDPIQIGAYTLRYLFADSDTGLVSLSSVEISNTTNVQVYIDDPVEGYSYGSTREDVAIKVKLINEGLFTQDIKVTTEIPDLNFTRVDNVHLSVYGEETLLYNFLYPDILTPGMHEVKITLEMDPGGILPTQTFMLDVHEPDLFCSLDKSEYIIPSDNEILTVENAGRAGEDYEYTIDILDINNLRLIHRETGIVTVQKGGIITVAFSLPDISYDGTYIFRFIYTDLITNQTVWWVSDIKIIKGLYLQLDKFKYIAGESGILTIENQQRPADRYDYTMTIVDKQGIEMYSDAGIINIPSGSSGDIGFTVPTGVTDGWYDIDLECIDSITFAKISFYESILIKGGITTQLKVSTNQETYSSNSTITGICELNNFTQQLQNAQLQIKVYEANDSWESFTAGAGQLASDNIRAIIPDEDYVWFVHGTFYNYQTQVTQYNRTNNTWNTYNPGWNFAFESYFNPFWDITPIVPDGKYTWFIGNYNTPLIKYDKDINTFTYSDYPVYWPSKIFVDKERIWIHQGIGYVVPVVHEYHRNNEMSGHIWDISHSQYYWEYDKLTQMPYAGLCANDGNYLWSIGSYNYDETINDYVIDRGIYRYDKLQKQWSKVYEGECVWLGKDKDYAWWTTNTWDSTLIRYSRWDDTWTEYNMQSISGVSTIFSMLEDENYTWFGTDKGVSQYDRIHDTWTSYTLFEGSYDMYTLTMFKEDNYIWFRTYGGTKLYDRANDTMIDFNIPADIDNVFFEAFDGENCWLAGTEGGVKRFVREGQKVWEKQLTVNADNYLKIEEQIPGLANMGKYYIEANLISEHGQQLSQSMNYFDVSILSGEVTLALETDKDVYQSSETVTITGTITNEETFALQNLTLALKKNDIVIHKETFSIDAEGEYTFIVQAIDTQNFNLELIAGDKTLTKLIEVYDDTTPPAITDISIPDGSIINTKSPVIEVTVSDNASGIDIDSIVVKLDGNELTVQYDAEKGIITFELPDVLEDGVHTIIFEISDRLGNTIPLTNWTFSVDTHAPETEFQVEGCWLVDVRKNYITSASTITLSAQDPEINGVSSGVKELRYTIDGGAESLMLNAEC